MSSFIGIEWILKADQRFYFKIIKKVCFSSYARETQVRLTQKHEEKLTFLAFRNDSQTLVDTQKLDEKHTFLVVFKRFFCF